jgi:hypothetical protein
MKWIIDRAFLFVIISLILTMGFSIPAHHFGGVYTNIMYVSIGFIIFFFGLCFFKSGR